jgi:hypothetical protein
MLTGRRVEWRLRPGCIRVPWPDPRLDARLQNFKDAVGYVLRGIAAGLVALLAVHRKNSLLLMKTAHGDHSLKRAPELFRAVDGPRVNVPGRRSVQISTFSDDRQHISRSFERPGAIRAYRGQKS